MSNGPLTMGRAGKTADLQHWPKHGKVPAKPPAWLPENQGKEKIMSELLVSSSEPDQEKCVLEVTPESAGWKYVGFAVHILARGDNLVRRLENREICIVILTGTITVEAGDETFSELGRRESVFDELSPFAVYVPPATAINITAHSDAEIALCSAPSRGGYSASLVQEDSDRGWHRPRRAH